MPTLVTAPINVTSAGDNIIVHGNATTPTIQVLGLYFQCGIATTVTVKQGTVAATGPMSFTNGGGLNLPNNGTSVYFQCDNGDNLVFNVSTDTLLQILGINMSASVSFGSSAASSVGGQIMYYQF